MKRFISIFMLVCMLASFMTVSAFADNVITTQSDFADAMNSATSGAVLTLGDGTFVMVAPSANVTIKGSGATVLTFPDGEKYADRVTYENINTGSSGTPGSGGENPGVLKMVKSGGGVNSAASLQAAIDTASSGATITLAGAIDVGNGTIIIPKTANITIDLAGFTISGSSNAVGHSMMENLGTLNVVDSGSPKGKMSYQYTGSGDSSYGSGNYTITNRGTLTMTGVVVENITAKMSHMYDAIDNNSTIGDAILNLNGCSVSCPNYIAIRQYGNSSTYKNILNITSGTTKGMVWLQDSFGAAIAELNITGGEFIPWDGDNRSVMVSGGSVPFEVNITGGTFDGTITTKSGTVEGELIAGATFTNEDDAKASEAMFNSDYKLKDNGDGTHTVVNPNAPAAPGAAAKPANSYSVPATGDMSNMPLWSALLIVFAAVAIMTTKKKKA